MKTIILAIMFGLLAAILVMGDLPQKIVNYGVTPSYAMGLNPGKTDPDRFRKHPLPDPSPLPRPVPEPSTLALMGSGIAGFGIYLFHKHRNKKK